MPRWSKATKKSRSTSTRRQAPNRPSSKSTAKGLPPPTPSEAAFEAALRALAGSAAEARVESVPADGVAEFLDHAFAQSDAYLNDRYSTIGDAWHFHTKIAGVSFEGRQDVIAGLRSGVALKLVRRPENPHDANAIEVWYGNLQLGFFNRGLAAQIAPRMDGGARYRARVASLSGPVPGASSGGATKHRGVNVYVEREAESLGIAPRSDGGTRQPGALDDAALAERVRGALIGTSQPHEAQRAVLERIDAGRNTLAVLGTGRGKSFCFQFAAALRAFAGAGKTLVVYPLRALANDQYEAVRRTLDPLGLRCFRANGSIEPEEREDLFAALRDGTWDLVLATPEFLEFHRDALSGPSLPSFAVVDEAHHLQESRHRPAYARLAATIRALNNPQILALTATANDETFARIVEELRIDAWVIDPTVRENLAVIDARETRDKHAYLQALLDDGDEKSIVYCNSRNEVTAIARRLRARFGDVVMFYHGKMPNAERLAVERFFREGQLRVVIATSAFGEGIDLPDVANVVLYHLNFDFAEFNQQAGRAGRNGAPARIHLLYGQKDRSLNEYLIDLDAPPLGVLRELYRGMKQLARPSQGSNQPILRSSEAEIAATLALDRARDRSVSAALRIFADAGLLETGEDDDGRFVRFLPVTGRVEMERNERFAEGEATREAFARFAETALTSPASTLERIINRPIYPSRAALLR
jgi:single-stranded-DNA-specific exonuclease